jgi:iron complex outermembrane recepter protein
MNIKQPHYSIITKGIIAFLLMILAEQVTDAQIFGRITDESDSPLEYAAVAVYNQQDSSLVTGTITDQTGAFRIGDVKKGSYYVVCSFIGFQPRKVENVRIDSRQDSRNLGSVALKLGASLEEVTIEAQRPTVISKIDRQVFDASSFESARGGTALDVLRNLPSVSINGEGEISVRGSTGFVALLNGKPVQGDPATLISQLPANSVNRIEVITAPSARYDPEGKAGMINIITENGAANGTYAQINIRGGFPSIERYGNAEPHQRYGVDAIYNLRKDGWNISLGANYQRNDLGGRREGDVYTIINDTMTRFPSTGERSFYDISYSGRFSVDYTPDTSNSFSFGLYAGIHDKDRLANIVYYDNHAITPPVDGDRIYTFQYYNHNLRNRRGDFALGSLDYSHLFSDQSRFSASFLYEYTLLGGPTVSQNLGYPDHSIVYQDEYNTNDNPLQGVRLRIDYRWRPFAFGTIETGYLFRNLIHTGDFFYERKNNETGEFELVPEFSSEVDLKRTIHSGYVQLSGSRDRLEYEAGIRLEAMDRTLDLRDKTNTVDTTYLYDFIKPYPAFSLQYSIKDDLKLKAAYSKRVERTTTFKMNPFPEREHSETLEQGDPTLLPEFIDLAELGMVKNFRGSSSLYATAYFRNVKNVVNRVNTIYNDTILNRIYSNVGNSTSLGLEIGAQLNPYENWTNFIGANIYYYSLAGAFNNRKIDSHGILYSINAQSTVRFWKTASIQFSLNYLSERITAQGEDSRYYQPNLTLRKTFLDQRLAVALQWQNIDMGLLNTNEQRITTYSEGEFYTTTNYIYEVDMVILNLSYTFSNAKNRTRFIKSEFGEREF